MPDNPDIETVIECSINDSETIILYKNRTYYVVEGDATNGNHPTLF